MVNKKNIVLLTLLLSILSIAFPKIISAQSTLFFDNFDSGQSGQWTTIRGIWSVQNVQSSNRFGMVLNGQSNSVEAQAGSSLWTNYEFSFDMLPVQGWDRNIFFRVGSERSRIANLDLPTGYALHMSPNWIDLQKWTPGLVNNPDIQRVAVSWDNNVARHFRVVLKENNVRIYSHNLNDPPSTLPLIDYTDNSSTQIMSGKIALVITTGAVFPSEVWFDNIIVTDIPTQPVLPSLNVQYLSQSDLSWSNDIYDSANKWSNHPYISRWGCALTSASMVLNYHGFNTNPKQLNEWLISQEDGYLGNGLLNWLALTRYSFSHKNLDDSALEYRRYGNNQADLIKELKDGLPPILKEPGHYVVGKSQLPSSFGINDPAFSERTSLEPYGNTYLALHSFHPTHTDLSYIMITIDPRYSIRVFDTSGDEILNQTFTEEGLVDDIDQSQNSADSIKIFQLPIPIHGEYKVEISGSAGHYDLQTYIYNKNADVKTFVKSGVIFANTRDAFTLKINENPFIQRDVTYETLLKDLNGIYGQKGISYKVFRMIKGEINLVKWLVSNSRNRLARIQLVKIYYQIKHLPPKFIEASLSKILLEDIKILLSKI